MKLELQILQNNKILVEVIGYLPFINQNFILLDSISKYIKKNICHLYLFNFSVILHIINLIAKRFTKI